MLDRVVEDVSGGQSLSRSFSRFPKVFSDFTVLYRARRRELGSLSASLSYLADELKKKQMLRRKLVGAFVYPAVITAATFGITAFLMLYLFPKIMPIFASLHTQLPLSTRLVMATSVFLQHWGLAALGALLACCFACSFALKRSAGIHRFFDRLMLRMPVVGTMLRYYNIANATRTLGLLLRSGIRLSEALPITAQTIHNRIYRREFLLLGRAIERGERMSAVHGCASRLYPRCYFQHAGGGRALRLACRDARVFVRAVRGAKWTNLRKTSRRLWSRADDRDGHHRRVHRRFHHHAIYGITQNLHG